MVVGIKTPKTHSCFVSSKTQTIWFSSNFFVSPIFVDLEWFGIRFFDSFIFYND